MFCVKCGAKIQEGTKFCIHCGTPVAGIPAAESPQVESPKVESPKSEGLKAESPKVESPKSEGPKAESPKVESPKSEGPKAETPETETSKVEIPKSETPKVEIPESESPKSEIREEEPSRSESSESDSIVIKIPKIKIPKVDSPAISETGEKVKELGKKYIKDGVEKAQKAYQYGSEQIKSGSITIPKPKMSKKKLSMIGGAAILVAVIAVVFSLFKGSGSGFSSPEKAFNAWMNGYCQHDFDMTLKAEPDFVIKYEGGEARLKETLQTNYFNQIAQKYANGYPFTWEATGHTMLSKDELEELTQRMNIMYSVKVKFSAAAVIQNQRIKIDGGEVVYSGTSGYAFKYKGKWYYLNVESL